jgi:tetratricopeptide (TPR) repeat protein
MAAVRVGDRPSDPDSRYLVGVSRRAARSRWIAGLVVTGGMALVGIAAGRRFLVKSPPPPAQPSAIGSISGRAQDLVRVGLRLLEQGDLDGAREDLAQARALGNNDASLLGALARLENVNAELVWLRLRLLDPGDQDSGQLAQRQLVAALERARKAVDAANQAAPGHPDVVRAQVDWLRLNGDLGKARELVGPLAAKPSDPANAYALGALDLAEPAPIWSSVLDRLRNAARADQGLGLARAALIYALVSAGQLEEARAELVSVAASARPHLLLVELRAFLRRAGESDAGEADAETASVDAETPSALEKTAPGERPVAAAKDYRDQLVRARSALGRGRLDEADGLYRAVLAKDPSNTEALTGLADVARARNDPRSTELYDQALARNPSYLPALMARADQKWSSGDRSGAVTLYRQVLEQAGPSSDYGQRAAARLAQGSAPAPSAGKKEAPTGSASRPTSPAPEIDTTDLSGLK